MSYEARLDTGPAIQVASTKGWGDVRRWADKLEVADYPQIHHLLDHGWSQDLPGLNAQLFDAVEAHMPDDAVLATVAGLVDFLDEHPDAGAIVITDGTSNEAD